MITRHHKSQRLSQLVRAGNSVYLAGQVAKNPVGNISEQTQQILGQIDNLLAEVGGTKTDIVSAQIWLKDIASFQEMNRVWDAWVDPENPPARACVQSVLARQELLVEIQVVAYLGA